MIAGIILSTIALAIAAYSLWLATTHNRKLRERIEDLQTENEQMFKVYEDLNNLCCISNPKEFKFEIMPFSGSYAVCKRKNGVVCLIKAFTDEDSDFSKREAEELCEILNSK